VNKALVSSEISVESGMPRLSFVRALAVRSHDIAD
jgi:hypothetical protein